MCSLLSVWEELKMTEENSEKKSMQGPVCPLPHQHTETVVIGHGSGGRMTQDLIQQCFTSRIGNAYLKEANDAARILLPKGTEQVAISTDSHVVSPIFYPGGNIGRLAVCGTVNDVAMLGAQPKYLTAGFILEEGFPITSLETVVDSMAKACQEANVKIVAGDTKVVEKNSVDQIFINTAGFGIIKENRIIGGQYAKPGDAVIISGSLGDHGIAVLEARGDLGFESSIQSDVAPLNHMIEALLREVPEVHVLRDPTRGGLATSLNEIACQSKVSILLDEENIPIKPNVQTACEMLGFDPLYLANEGKLIVICPATFAEKATNALRTSPYGIQTMRIGEVFAENPGRVLLRTQYGSTRILDMLNNEILPRIC